MNAPDTLEDEMGNQHVGKDGPRGALGQRSSPFVSSGGPTGRLSVATAKPARARGGLTGAFAVLAIATGGLDGVPSRHIVAPVGFSRASGRL